MKCGDVAPPSLRQRFGSAPPSVREDHSTLTINRLPAESLLFLETAVYSHVKASACVRNVTGKIMTRLIVGVTVFWGFVLFLFVFFKKGAQCMT